MKLGSSARQLIRKSNKLLLKEASGRPGQGRLPGATAFQVRSVASNQLENLFVGDCLVEDALESPPYAKRALARHLPSGQMVRVSTFSKELSLNAENYRDLTGRVLRISHDSIVQPSEVINAGDRLVVVRPYIAGESFTQLKARIGAISSDTVIRLSILLLKTLEQLDAHRIIWLHPSQVIITGKEKLVLVDLDEAEAIYFKRHVRLKATNAPLLTTTARKFIAPEVQTGEKSDSRRVMLYSVGQIAGFLTRSDASTTKAGNRPEAFAGPLTKVIERLTETDPSKRPGTYSNAIQQFQLAFQSSHEQGIDYPVFPLPYDLSNRPLVSTISSVRCLLVAAVLVLGISALVGAFSLFTDSSAYRRTQEEVNETTIHSDDVFSIP